MAAGAGGDAREARAGSARDALLPMCEPIGIPAGRGHGSEYPAGVVPPFHLCAGEADVEIVYDGDAVDPGRVALGVDGLGADHLPVGRTRSDHANATAAPKVLPDGYTISGHARRPKAVFVRSPLRTWG